jgi:DNA-directed RNA polymerase subunit L
MNINIKDSSSENVLEFDIDGVKMSLVNALRRIMISEVNTVAFETSNFEESSVQIIENSSQFHNEFLLHRIGLIPINIVDTANFNESDYTFSLNVENKTNSVLDITAGDIVVTNNTTGKTESTEKFFPKDPISNENILIVRLQPNPSGVSEKLNFTGSARVGNGSIDARYSPTSVCFYINTIDPDAANAGLAKFKETSDKQLSDEKVTKKFLINESERYFHKDADGEPNKFSFTIESIGVIPPQEILGRAINILNEKLEKFQVEIGKKDSTYIDIEETPTSMDAYDLTVENESHTLGFVIQEHANQLISDKDLVYVGYMNPHPLKKNIKLRVALSSNNVENVNKQLTFVCKNIINKCNEIKSAIEQKFGQIGQSKTGKVVVETKKEAEESVREETEEEAEETADSSNMEGGNVQIYEETDNETDDEDKF